MTERRVEFEVTSQDFLAGAMSDAREDGSIRRSREHLMGWGAVFVVAAAGTLVGVVVGTRAPAWALFTVLGYMLLTFAFGFLYLVQGSLAARAARKAFSDAYATPTYQRFMGRCTIAAGSAGFHAVSRAGEYHHPWAAVVRVKVEDGYAFVTAGLLRYPIPRRAFPSDAAFDEFVGAIRRGIEPPAAG